MSGFENDIMFAKNADFTVSDNQNVSENNGLVLDNQVWLGSTATNIGGTHINVTTLTAGTGISLTRNTAVNPNTLTIANTGSVTDLHTARFIVSAGGSTDGANFTTIAAAYAAALATGGVQTVFIQPGTYTENITLSPGINLSAYPCDAYSQQGIGSPNVIILGKLTATFTGVCSISGIQLKTNSDFCLSVTGSNNTGITLVDCFLYANNNTAISYTTSGGNSKIELFNCKGDIATTGISYFAHSSAGRLLLIGGFYNNNGGSSTASTLSGTGSVVIENTTFLNSLTTSSTSAMNLFNSTFTGVLTVNSTAAATNNSVYNSVLNAGTSTALTIGAGATVDILSSSISTSNTAAISGAGTVRYSGVTFNNSSHISATGQTVLNMGPSSTIGSSNSGGTNTLTVTNSSNTASSNAAIISTVAGTSAADAYYQAIVAGTTTWTWGIDNSDSDAWALSANAALGTTNVMRVSTAGEINYPLQPSFLAYLNTTVTNVSGDATEYTVIFDTEVFDQNADFNLATSVFTAPVTGRYFMQFSSLILGGTSITGANARIVTSNRTYNNTMLLSPLSSTACSMNMSVIVDMDAADTATFTIQTSDTGGKIDDISGTTSGNLRTFVSGNLLC